MLIYPRIPPGNMVEYYRMLQCQLIGPPFVTAHLMHNVHAPQRMHVLPGLLQKPEGHSLFLLEAVGALKGFDLIPDLLIHPIGLLHRSLLSVAPVRMVHVHPIALVRRLCVEALSSERVVELEGIAPA